MTVRPIAAERLKAAVEFDLTRHHAVVGDDDRLPGALNEWITNRCPAESSRASALAKRSEIAPCAGAVREAYPASHNGSIGVMQTLAAPAW